MQQSKTEHISEQEAKEQLEKQAGLTFEYAHAQYNKNLKQWSFAVKNKAGAVVFSAVSFKDFAPYRALARHLNTSFEEVLDRYVFVSGAQHECGQGQDDERYCLIDKGWLKVSDIEEAFIKKFGQYRKDYEMHDELWVLTIDGSECSSSTYKKHPKPGWPPRSERAVVVLEELESQALQLSFDAFLTPAEQPLSTSDKETPPEQPQTALHSQKPVQPTEPAVSNTDTGKPKKQNEPSRAAESAGSNTGKQKKQNEHKWPAQDESEKRGCTVTEQDDADDLYNTARNYRYGLGGLKKDKATALEWFRKAANMGNAAALYNIAVYYQNGLAGFKADKTIALEWFRKAADKGQADAMNMIGRYYDEGWGGLKTDKAAALEWYRKAVDAGAMNEIYDKQGEAPATTLECVPKTAEQNDTNAAEMVKQLEKPTQTDVKIDNHKKVTVYFKKIFRFDRYVDINYIIYMVCLVSGFISIFFDSDTRKGTFVILSAVSITASGLSILYSALVFCAMYI